MKMLLSLFLLLFGLGADVVTVTTGTAGNAGNVAASLVNYLALKLLDVAELNMVLNQFGEKVPLPNNSSKTIQFVREEKFATSSVPTQLTEGIAPDAVGLTMNQFTATVEQYGLVVRLSELSEITAKHPVVQRTLKLLGIHAAETYDQLLFNVLDAATNQYRPNGRAADANIIGSDRTSYIDLVSLQAALMDQGGKMLSNGKYIFATPPQVHASLLTDPDFKAAAQFAAPERIWNGHVADLGGFSIVVSNAPGFSPTTSAVSGQANKIYSSFGLASDAYQITDLQNLQMFVVAPGGHPDPLQQSRLLFGGLVARAAMEKFCNMQEHPMWTTCSQVGVA